MIGVTGATGFIGSILCQQLLEQGFTVRALVRKPANAAPLSQLGVILVEGDLNDTSALANLVSDCSAVIHGAGAVRGNSQEDFDRVNVVGTQAIAAALQQHAPQARLIHLSSLVAREPRLSYYSRSKQRGEDTLKPCEELNWVIVRPPAVYGPGDKEMLPLFKTMYRGLALIPGSPDARTSLIHVHDLVAAIIACMHSDDARHQTFQLGDGQEGGYSWRQIASIAQDLWSRRVRLWQIPPWLLNTVATLNSALAGLTGAAPMLTPPKLRELRHPDWVVDNTALTSVTGWKPRIKLREGLEQLKISAL